MMKHSDLIAYFAQFEGILINSESVVRENADSVKSRMNLDRVDSRIADLVSRDSRKSR